MRHAVIGSLLVLLLVSAQAADAQQPPPPAAPVAPVVAESAALGSLELGVLDTHASGDVARLERYRDLQSNAFSRVTFGRVTENYLFQANAQGIGRRDQRYDARYYGAGFTAAGGFTSIPLNYSYLSSTPWVESSPDVFTLDQAARQLVQAKQVVGVPQNVTDLNTASIYRGIAHPFDLQQLRQTGDFGFTYDATSRLSVDGGLSSSKRAGQQPYGASFAFNVANELPMRVDNRTTDASAGLEWTHDRGMLRVGWNGQWFDNSMTQLVWDNAFRATDTNPIDASGYSNGNGSAQGRMAMPPSNSLSSVMATGLYKMPAHSTVNGSVAFTQMTQNQALIPWTINPVINTPAVFSAFPHLAALPRATAEAKVDGINAVINLTTRPNRYFGLTTRYRYNDHVNKTPPFDATEYVRFDAVPEETGGVTQQFNITQNTLDVNANFNLIKYTSLRVGYGHDSYDRTGRAFSNMSDNTLRVSVDTMGNQYLTMRAMYDYTKRVGSGFSEASVEEGGSQPGLRFYDESNRNRSRGTLVFTGNPIEKLDVTFSLASGKDTYNGPGHEFGLLDNDNTAVNIGVNVYPTAAIGFGVNYGRDHFASNQLSRNANPPPDPTFNDPSRNWSLNNEENVNNFNFYLDLPKLNRKTNVRVTYDYSDSDNGFTFGGPRIPALAAIGQFIPLPNVTNKWHQLAADLQYFFVPKVGVGVGYWFEKYDVSDFATIDIPGQPGTPRIDYLGEISTGYGNRPYTGNTVFVRLLYHF